MNCRKCGGESRHLIERVCVERCTSPSKPTTWADVTRAWEEAGQAWSQAPSGENVGLWMAVSLFLGLLVGGAVFTTLYLSLFG